MKIQSCCRLSAISLSQQKLIEHKMQWSCRMRLEVWKKDQRKFTLDITKEN